MISKFMKEVKEAVSGKLARKPRRKKKEPLTPQKIYSEEMEE